MICSVAVHPQVDRVPVRIIVMETQEKAEQVLGELKAGADFAAVAKAESTDPTAAEGGSLGMVTPEGLRTELRGAMQGLEPGQYSGIVRMPSGDSISTSAPRRCSASANDASVRTTPLVCGSHASVASSIRITLRRFRFRELGLAQAVTAFRPNITGVPEGFVIFWNVRRV